MKCPNCRRDLPNHSLRCPYCNSLTSSGYNDTRYNYETEPVYNNTRNNRRYYSDQSNYYKDQRYVSYNYNSDHYGNKYYDYPDNTYYDELYYDNNANKGENRDINTVLISMCVFIIGMQIINLLAIFVLMLRM